MASLAFSCHFMCRFAFQTQELQGPDQLTQFRQKQKARYAVSYGIMRLIGGIRQPTFKHVNLLSDLNNRAILCYVNCAAPHEIYHIQTSVGKLAETAVVSRHVVLNDVELSLFCRKICSLNQVQGNSLQLDNN